MSVCMGLTKGAYQMKKNFDNTTNPIEEEKAKGGSLGDSGDFGDSPESPRSAIARVVEAIVDQDGRSWYEIEKDGKTCSLPAAELLNEGKSASDRLERAGILVSKTT